MAWGTFAKFFAQCDVPACANVMTVSIGNIDDTDPAISHAEANGWFIGGADNGVRECLCPTHNNRTAPPERTSS